MRTQTERSADLPTTHRNAWLDWWRGVALGVFAATAVAVIDWAGVDRDIGTRLLAGIFALLSTLSLTTAALSRRWRTSRSSIVGDLCGGVATALMVPGQLVSDSLVSAAFMLVGGGFMVASIVAMQRHRRELKSARLAARGANGT